MADEAIARGDVRTARALLRAVLAAGAEADKVGAGERLGRLSVDPRALLAAGGLLLVIVFAAWAAILRHH